MPSKRKGKRGNTCCPDLTKGSAKGHHEKKPDQPMVMENKGAPLPTTLQRGRKSLLIPQTPEEEKEAFCSKNEGEEKKKKNKWKSHLE